ncbi:hypothetical protein HGRIS_013444 [Hohenbuehelia grisea]|uniref:Uncharacterized protein n=1 Tax=Hohenbuehelia grisea TaxID=104357 RepID=A0ABR3IVR7_9AGAR
MPSLKERIYRSYESGILLPGIIFPLLTATAVHFLFVQMTNSELGKDVAEYCPELLGSNHPFRLHYTGLEVIDRVLCTLVSFFHAILEPETSQFLMYFMSTGAITFVFPLVESRRAGRHIALGWPLIIGFFSQTMTVGLTLTMYWLLFIWTGAARRKPIAGAGAGVTQAEAEAVVFAIAVGMGVPTAGLLFMKDATVTALWQAFPALASLGVAAHLLIRPMSRHSESGYNTIRALYIGIFMISSSAHLAMVAPLLNDLPALKALLLPSLTSPPVAAATRDKVENFLKWDAVYAFGSMMIGSLWFAKDGRQVVKLAEWYTVATPIVGPGAAITAVLLWRESLLANDVEPHIKDE